MSPPDGSEDKALLFEDAKFCLADDLQDDEEFQKVLINNGGTLINYLSDNVTYVIADNPDSSTITEAQDLYEKPVATLSEEDTKSLWAMVTFYGGKFRAILDKTCTHLVAAKAEGQMQWANFQQQQQQRKTPDGVVPASLPQPQQAVQWRPTAVPAGNDELKAKGPQGLAGQPPVRPEGGLHPQQQVALWQQQQAQQLQLHKVTPKTKTALANLLNTRLQGVARGPGDLGADALGHGIVRLPTPASEDQQQAQHIRDGPMMNPAYRSVRAPVPPPAQHLANDARNFGTEVPVNVNAPEVHFYGHDPRTQVPTEMCLVGCVFCIVDYDRVYEPSEILKWKKVIMQRGGEVEEIYSPRCTHVICDTQRSTVVQQALRESKRCVTVFWLNDVLMRKKLQAPWHALHFPSPYLENKPCKNQIICTTGFDSSERALLKQMILTTGAKYTTYLTRLNSLLIAKKKEGLKYQKAQEWGIGIVNTQWLQDVMLGHYEALRLPTAPKYQQFEDVRLDYGLVPHLMAAWRIPIKLTEEVWKRFTTSEAFKEAQKRKQENPVKSEATAPKQPRLSPEEEENIPVTVSTTLPEEKVPQGVLQLGGALAKSPKECTHLVTNRIQRTVKLLSAFGTAKFVVTARWIKDSIANNAFLEERPYQVEDPDAEKTFGFSLDQVLQRTDRTPLFKASSRCRNNCAEGTSFTLMRWMFCGMIFFITPGVYPSPPILKDIVECSGGMVYLKKRPSLKQVTSVTQGGTKFIVISCDNDLHLCRDYMSKNISIYSAEFILTGVLRQCVEFDAFLLS
ncbi:hypothetical protein HPB50_019399 [Hyalomma asiaticum]|uniref:Uncharacterized protein n=1 Tax=Hyalomma asiaticum TaxID=266040 RepID=A0ACB7SGC6_HYAAI|nr:hypothetical protein HPB50_019399 [Hyalomma asiaticum]